MSAGRRGGRGRARHGGGPVEAEKDDSERWMISYADMMTLLMVLFIVLFAISQVDQRKFAALKAKDGRCSLKVTGGINRPPMERTRGTVRLYERARVLAADLGFKLEEAATGGASDGNFTSSIGIPTLDGMGAVGEGAHADHESILIEHLAPRTALLAALLAS